MFQRLINRVNNLYKDLFTQDLFTQTKPVVAVKPTVVSSAPAKKELTTATIRFHLDERSKLPIASAVVINNTPKLTTEVVYAVNRGTVPFSRGEIIVYKGQSFRIDSFDEKTELFCLKEYTSKEPIFLSTKQLHKLSKKKLKEFLVRDNKLTLPTLPITVAGQLRKDDRNKTYFVIEKVL